MIDFIPILADAASKVESSNTGYITAATAILTAASAGFFTWYSNKSKSRNDQFASFMSESEKYRKELREELEKQQKKCEEDVAKLKVMVKDQDILIQVLEEKQSLDTKYKAIVDSMPQVVWTAKPDGNVDYYNARGYQYAGRPLNAGRDYGWSIVFHPEDLEKGLEIWRQSLTTGSTYYYPYRIKRGSDGMYRWHLGIAMPRINENGEVLQWIGSCTDIHDYREAILRRIRVTNPEFPEIPEKEIDNFSA